jgi:hypothetical protein
MTGLACRLNNMGLARRNRFVTGTARCAGTSCHRQLVRRRTSEAKDEVLAITAQMAGIAEPPCPRLQKRRAQADRHGIRASGQGHHSVLDLENTITVVGPGGRLLTPMSALTRPFQ